VAEFNLQCAFFLVKIIDECAPHLLTIDGNKAKICTWHVQGVNTMGDYPAALFAKIQGKRK
jgi:hypothetical protein